MEPRLEPGSVCLMNESKLSTTPCLSPLGFLWCPYDLLPRNTQPSGLVVGTPDFDWVTPQSLNWARPEAYEVLDTMGNWEFGVYVPLLENWYILTSVCPRLPHTHPYFLDYDVPVRELLPLSP